MIQKQKKKRWKRPQKHNPPQPKEEKPFVTAYPHLRAGVPTKMTPQLRGIKKLPNGGQVYLWKMVCVAGASALEKRMVAQGLKHIVDQGPPFAEKLSDQEILALPLAEQQRIYGAIARRKRQRAKRCATG